MLQKGWEDAATQERTWLLVSLSLSLRAKLLEAHAGVSGGHLGCKKTLYRLCQRLYCDGMRRGVEEWCKLCHVCAAKKGPARSTRAPLQLYQSGSPMERVAVDIAGPLPCTPRGNRYILVAMDYFSKWPEVYGIPDHEAKL